jgi:anti-sigma regulatory factor (Ser/Thr protein kinase)
VLDDAVLVVSELVANGVVHGGNDPIALRVDLDGHGICIEVTTAPQSTRRRPTLRAERSEGGRGLGIVAACRDGIAVRTDDRGYRHVVCRVA